MPYLPSGTRVPALADDLELIVAMKEEMKFIPDPKLIDSEAKVELIRYFEDSYCCTDQDTVLYGPEFVIVVRSILQGQRPVKLRFLTDFEGEVLEGVIDDALRDVRSVEEGGRRMNCPIHNEPMRVEFGPLAIRPIGFCQKCLKHYLCCHTARYMKSCVLVLDHKEPHHSSDGEEWALDSKETTK